MNRHETWCALRSELFLCSGFFLQKEKNTQKHFSKQNVSKKLVESTCVNWFLCTLDWTHVIYLIAGGRECWRRCKGQIVLLNDEMKVIDRLSWCEINLLIYFYVELKNKIKWWKQAISILISYNIKWKKNCSTFVELVNKEIFSFRLIIHFVNIFRTWEMYTTQYIDSRKQVHIFYAPFNAKLNTPHALSCPTI